MIKDPKLAPGFAASALPGWGNVTPFTLVSASQYWLPGPPALSSEQYARDFNEVKSLGGQVSPTRTPEQTEMARFWFEGPSAWYRIARAASEVRGLDFWDSARTIAAVSLAMADGFIAGFKIRYVYDFWRPVTAIREAAELREFSAHLVDGHAAALKCCRRRCSMVRRLMCFRRSRMRWPPPK
jgi:hypothetical protein